MDYSDHTTEHESGKHLTYENYVTIEIRIKDGWTTDKIAVNELRCAPNTVRNIIKEGMTPLYHGKVCASKLARSGRHIKRTADIVAGVTQC